MLGLDSLPEAGDDFQVVTDTAKAKQIVIFREAEGARSGAGQDQPPHARAAAQADARRARSRSCRHHQDGRGRLGRSAHRDAAEALEREGQDPRDLHSGVGAINESDVLLASASNAIIIGFNVRPERNAAALAEQEKVDIRLHTIIYNLTDEIKRAMTGLLDPVFKEVYKGKAEVRERSASPRWAPWPAAM